MVRAGVSIIRTLDPTRDAGAVNEAAQRADAVLVDAPCSGLGTVRRNPGLKYRFSPELIQHLVDQQRLLLASSSALVRSGGRLVYATCTISRRENEDNVRWFLETFPHFRILESREVLRESGIAVEGKGPELLLLPHRSGSDGFFAAVLQRGDG
jgi:16S rRNA (cytosine967-C5)-methyltransferase